MASVATKMAVGGNIHMDTREINVAGSNLRSNWTSEAVWGPPRPLKSSPTFEIKP